MTQLNHTGAKLNVSGAELVPVEPNKCCDETLYGAELNLINVAIKPYMMPS